jgi:hypothetical protein
MSVADLGAGRAGDLAGGGLLALDEPGVGEEVLDAGEADGFVDLVEQRETEDTPDAGDRPEEPERLGIIDLGSKRPVSPGYAR